MFVLMYIDASGGISVIQEDTLEKVNKKIRIAVQKDYMDIEDTDNDAWDLYLLRAGTLVKQEGAALITVPQFM